MPRIQCLLGPKSDVYVGGIAYNFVTDEHGRAVANVPNQLHVQCFLSIDHFRLLPDGVVLGDAVKTADEGGNDDDLGGNDQEVVSQVVEPGSENQPADDSSPADADNSAASDDNSETETDTDAESADTDATEDDKQPAEPDVPTEDDKPKRGRPKKADAATEPNAQ